MFLKVGHRGARAYETENTIACFKKAIDLGVNSIEFDLQKTADGELIVSHDDNLNRVFRHDISIEASSLRQLKDLTSGQVPTFIEALEFIDGKVDRILVELKKEGYEKDVLDQIARTRLHDRIVIVSFLETALAEIRRLDKKIETGLIYTRHKTPIASAIRLNAQYLLPLFSVFHTKNIQEAHNNNLKVVVWTINSRKEVEKYKAKGVDGIASDRPDIL